jgi:hypothetical protein
MKMKKKYLNKIMTFLFFVACSILYLQSQNVLADNHSQVKKKIASNYSVSSFEKGYFKYKFNSDKKTVTIMGYTDTVNRDTLEAEKLIIPCEVNYNGYTYPVTVVGDQSFQTSRNEEIVISDGIQEVYFSFLRDNNNVKSISIPSSVEQIHCKNIGSWVNNIEKVTVSKRNSNYESVDKVIYSKDEKTLVCAFAVNGKYIVNGGITRIGDYAFSNNSNLSGVILPQGVTDVGDYAFAHTGLEGIFLPDTVTNIGEGAFQGDAYLLRISIPMGIKEIKDNTFFGCASLKEIILPEGVETIGRQALASCRSVSKLDLPASLKKFDQSAFDFMSKEDAIYGKLPLKSSDFTLAEGNSCFCLQDGAILSKDKTVLYKVVVGKNNYEVPSTVKLIMDRAFSNNYALQNVTIHRGIAWIPASCFAESSVMAVTLPDSIEDVEQKAFFNSGLKQINLPKGLKRIEDEAFMGSQIEDLSFPSTLEYIGYRAFYDLEKIKNLQFLGKKPPEIVAAIDAVPQQWNTKVDRVYVPKGTKKAYEEALCRAPLLVNKVIEAKQRLFKVEANSYAQIIVSLMVHDDIGKYTFRLDGTDYQKSTVFNSVIPGKTYTVYAKKGLDVFQAKVKVPSMIAEITSDRIVVIPPYASFPGYEYKLGDGKWTTETTFEGLSPNTKYTLYRRKTSSNSKNTNKIVKDNFHTKSE